MALGVWCRRPDGVTSDGKRRSLQMDRRLGWQWKPGMGRQTEPFARRRQIRWLLAESGKKEEEKEADARLRRGGVVSLRSFRSGHTLTVGRRSDAAWSQLLSRERERERESGSAAPERDPEEREAAAPCRSHGTAIREERGGANASELLERSPVWKRPSRSAGERCKRRTTRRACQRHHWPEPLVPARRIGDFSFFFFFFFLIFLDFPRRQVELHGPRDG